MIAPEHALPIKRQAELAGISRGAVYYLPRPVSEVDQRLMRRIDELHLEHPFAGARMLRDLLGREGVKVGRKHVATLMARLGHRGAVPQAQHEQEAPGAQGLPVPAAWLDHRAGQPALGDGHHTLAERTS